MGLELHRRYLGNVFGSPRDVRATDPDDPATIVALLKGWMACYPAPAADPPILDMPQFRMENPSNAIGSPGDERATTTTEPSTMVSLLKGILNGMS